MAAKIQIKNDSVRNFGGFFSFVDHFRKDGAEDIVNKTLGHRSIFAKYSNSDIFLSLAAIFLTGGSCIEDANVFDKPRADKLACMPRRENVCCEATNRLSHNFTENSQGYKFCSADTILRMIKTAKSDNEEFVSKAGTKYQFSINKSLCEMLLDGLMRTRQVQAGEAHVFDYDNLSEERMPTKPDWLAKPKKGLEETSSSLQRSLTPSIHTREPSDTSPASRRSTDSRFT